MGSTQAIYSVAIAAHESFANYNRQTLHCKHGRRSCVNIGIGGGAKLTSVETEREKP
jgi:hypothetical protein